MGRRFVDMSVIQRRMQFKDDRINRRLAKAQMTDLAPTLPAPDVIAKVIIEGDLAKLTYEQKISYYRAVCDSIGVNPLTKPFDYIQLGGKLVLYASRNCTDQLRKIHGISVQIMAREMVEDCYVVTARATFPNGRHDESTGAVAIAGTKGEVRANLMLKCETKSKRRVTLSIVGLSFLDESEVDSIPGAQVVPVEHGRECSPPPLNKSLTPSPGPAVPTAVVADPGLGVPAAPANMPESWQPFVVDDPDRLRGQIVAIHDETKTGKKSGRPFTKWSITLDGGETVTTLDRDVASVAMTARDDGRPVEVATKSTRWGKYVVTIATLPMPGDEIPF